MNNENKEQNYERITLTAKEAAAYIGISYWTLLEIVKQHKIPAINAGTRKLFRKKTLDDWMENQEKASTSPNEVGGQLGAIL